MTQERETVLAARGVIAGTAWKNDEGGISFSVAKKGIHGILGPDGSGKGALLRVLAGIDKAREGVVELGGTALSPENTDQRRLVSYVPADCALVGSMTVGETLEFAGNAKRVGAELLPRQIKEAEELLGLDGMEKRLVRRIGAAERWRLTLAMALLGNPEILLIEEPMRALGEDSEQERIELLSMLGRVKTVVLATSSYPLARTLCEDVILLSDGKRLAEGSFEELESRLAQSGGGESLEEIYRKLCAAAESREEVAE